MLSVGSNWPFDPLIDLALERLPQLLAIHHRSFLGGALRSRYAECMLGIDYRAARAAWTVFLVALLIATAYAIRATLVVLATALLFAYLLIPLVDLVQRYTPRQISPNIALALVYIAFIGALVALAVTIGSSI